MKRLAFQDTCANRAQYAIPIPDAMEHWRLDACLEFLASNPAEHEEKGFLPRAEHPILHERLRRLVRKPEITLNLPLTYWQNGHQLEKDALIDLHRQENVVLLKRKEGSQTKTAPDLTARHKGEFIDYEDVLIPIFDSLFNFTHHVIQKPDGLSIAGFSELRDVFADLDVRSQVRTLYRFADLVYQSPFENLSKLLDDIPFRSGLEMWLNIAGGFGGVCAEKTAAFKFVCDILGIGNRPVFGSAAAFTDPEKQIDDFVRGNDPEMSLWLQHHLLEIHCHGQQILVDVTNGNAPLLFLCNNDRENRMHHGLRGRMVYHLERQQLCASSPLAGDLMSTYSEYHVPTIAFHLIFEQGLGLFTNETLHLGAICDWHEETSARMQARYAEGARRAGLPFPRFVHMQNVDSCPDEGLREMLRTALTALHLQYPKKEYTGDFTIVIQPLSRERWNCRHVSKPLWDMLGPITTDAG